MDPQNHADIRAFLAFQAEVRQVSPLTIGSNKDRLAHLLTWSAARPFGAMAAIKQHCRLILND